MSLCHWMRIGNENELFEAWSGVGRRDGSGGLWRWWPIMKCPHCNSSNTQLLSAVYKLGTKFDKDNKPYHQTPRARLASPPVESSFVSGMRFAMFTITGFSFIASAFMFFTVVSRLFHLIFNTSDYIVLVVCIALSYLFLKISWAVRTNKSHEDNLAMWERSWLCHQCAKVFDGKDKN